MARLDFARISGLFAVSVAFALACGGAAEGDSGGSTGGASGSGATGTVTGGANSTGGVSSRGGTSATGGAATGGSAQGGSACCLALAVCDSGDTTLPGASACSANGSCYSRSICCSTVWCERGAQCDAIPVCDPGDVQLSGECPPDVSGCYSRSLCGTTITCRAVTGTGGSPGVGGSAGTAGAGGAESCDPASEYNRNYVATSPGTCALIRFTCAGRTGYFANACGCGCEQDASCPQSVDCMPGIGTPNPLCGADGQARCPFTLRAL